MQEREPTPIKAKRAGVPYIWERPTWSEAVDPKINVVFSLKLSVTTSHTLKNRGRSLRGTCKIKNQTKKQVDERQVMV